MRRTDQLRKLKAGQKTVDALRSQLCISEPNEVLYRSALDAMSTKEVIVEADGTGGAKLLVVDGNYPIDYSIFREQRFPTEEDACEMAEKLAK
jgi:hypothetical protein